MNPIFERLCALMKERGVKASHVTKELKLSNSAFTDWKNGKCSPGVETLSKLAPYFGVSLDYLITGKESAAPSRVESRERAFLDKLRLLPPACMEHLATYMDEMLAALEPDSAKRNAEQE